MRERGAPLKIVIGIAIAGFLGAVTRYELGWVFPQGNETAFPWATLAVNLSGSLLLGLLFGWASRAMLPAWLVETAGTGFLGTYTTFSAFNGQLLQLLRHEAILTAALYAALSGIVGWKLAQAGLAWGKGGAS
jgi:CrcB protein